MASYRSIGFFLLVVLVLVCASVTSSKSLEQADKIIYPSEFDMVEDDGSMDNALLNYLFARQMVHRLRNNMNVADLQKKRSYFKQCAFNAVSCFGKK